MAGQSGSETRQKETGISLRVSGTDRTKIRGKANLAGISVSEYVRAAALRRRVHAVSDRKAMADLRRAGGLLRWWLTDGEGKDGERHCRGKAPTEHKPQINRILDAIERAVLRIADGTAIEDEVAGSDGDDC